MSRLKKFLVDIDLSENMIKNVGTPVNGKDAVNKLYVQLLQYTELLFYLRT